MPKPQDTKGDASGAARCDGVPSGARAGPGEIGFLDVNRLLHERLGSRARASSFLLGAQWVAGSARPNLRDPRVHPVLMASVPT